MHVDPVPLVATFPHFFLALSLLILFCAVDRSSHTPTGAERSGGWGERGILYCRVQGSSQLAILDAIRAAGMTDDVRFYQASTSELYGEV